MVSTIHGLFSGTGHERRADAHLRCDAVDRTGRGHDAPPVGWVLGATPIREITMAVLRECLRRVWGALRRNPADHELKSELRFHLEQAEEELRGRGHSPAAAARLARVRLGGFSPGG